MQGKGCPQKEANYLFNLAILSLRQQQQHLGSSTSRRGAKGFLFFSFFGWLP
jgi:hypothetical protein